MCAHLRIFDYLDASICDSGRVHLIGEDQADFVLSRQLLRRSDSKVIAVCLQILHATLGQGGLKLWETVVFWVRCNRRSTKSHFSMRVGSRSEKVLTF
jgi:hypothetical protein